jgi:hypothetical protein
VAAVLADGRLMLVGGYRIGERADRPLASAVIWDPGTGQREAIRYPGREPMPAIPSRSSPTVPSSSSADARCMGVATAPSAASRPGSPDEVVAVVDPRHGTDRVISVGMIGTYVP